MYEFATAIMLLYECNLLHVKFCYQTKILINNVKKKNLYLFNTVSSHAEFSSKQIRLYFLFFFPFDLF